MSLVEQPVSKYLESTEPSRNVRVHGPARELTIQGRRGIQVTSVHSRIEIPEHPLNEPEGSLTLWVLAFEDLATVSHQEHIRAYDPYYAAYALLSDSAEPRAWEEATFGLIWSSGWYPQFFAKFFRGNIYPEAYRPVHKAFLASGHWSIKPLKWYQVCLTWNKRNSDYRMYLNSVRVASSNRFEPLTPEACNSIIYAGNTVFLLSDLCFYDKPLEAETLRAVYYKEATAIDSQIDSELQRTYAGKGLSTLEWKPGNEWQLQFDATLTRSEHLQLFRVQGCKESVRCTSDGLEIKTRPQFSGGELPDFSKVSSRTDPITTGPLMRHLLNCEDGKKEWPNKDRSQVYLWTAKNFEGDLAIDLEFMPLQEYGLSLLILQASGMQREDFLVDYVSRESGSMSTLCWENIRNYHWEFFRQLSDARNDVASHVLVKNPWLRPLAYQCQEERMAINTWHRLQFVQERDRLYGAVDGTLVIETRDLPSIGTGGILDFGHVGLRAMLNTHICFRNLKILSRPAFEISERS